MSIDKKYWVNFHFRNDRIPVILCPTCKEGRLIRNEDFNYMETRSSIELRDLYNSNEMNYEENYVGFLVCDNKKCKENVAVIGTAFLEPDEPEFDNQGEFVRQPFYTYYKPHYFTPALEIFNLKKEYPISVNKALKDSFKLFFTDTESCANKIRVVVEILLDNLKLKKTFINKKGKRESYNLHKRVELYKPINAEIVELLLSVKWIGNFGSHKDKLKKDDLIDAYIFLQIVLDKLYDDSSKKILGLSKAINKNRKPASKLKIKKMKSSR